MATQVVPLMMAVPEFFVALVPLVYTLAVLAPPLLHAAGYHAVADPLFSFFRGFCHQLPHRSLFLFDEQIAVCARCFALSASLAGVALIAGRVWALGFKRVRVPIWAIGLAAVPMALDGFSQLFGFRESTNTLRVLTGTLLGGMTSLWTVPMVCAAFDDMKSGQS